jgi:GNAT superfamily N-acetyltransferase
MPLTVHTDQDRIRGLLESAVAADPVRGTILGTLASSLEDGAWCAVSATGLAARSGADYPLVISGTWEPAALTELIAVLRSVPGLRGASGPVAAVDQVTNALWSDTPAMRMGQCLFRLDQLVEPAGVTGSGRIADDADRELVRAWFVAFMNEADAVERHAERAADRSLDAGGCFLWQDSSGAPVSLAARRPVQGGSARIGPVYTPPEHRGHGYGSAVTAAATRSILAEGAIPLLFTDLANPTSNKIYRALGYRPVEERVIVTLR